MMIASCFGGPLCSFVVAVLMLVCAFCWGFFLLCFSHFVLVLGGVWKGRVESEGLCKGLRKVGRRQSL